MPLARLPSIKNPWAPIFVSGLLGFIDGIFGYPSWHHAVEGAQALSGIVSYPFPTPFYIYQVKAWTLLHQIPAFFLMLGASEIQISQVLSGLVAGLAFMSLTAAAYAVTTEALFSVAIPFLINYTGMISYGPVYPILLMGATTSYGIFGQFWMFLTLAALSLKRHRVGAFCLGIAPAIHPALAVMTYAIVIPALWISGRTFWQRFIFFWAAGVFVCAVSYFANPLFPGFQPIAEITPVSKELLAQYLRNWDSHRMPVAWDDPGVWINFLATLIAATAYLRHREKLPETASFLLLCSLIAGIHGALGMVISWMPVERVPTSILRVMPARVLNFNILLYPVLAIGLLKKRDGLVAQVVTSFALVYFLIIARFEQFFTNAAIFFIGLSSLILSLGGWSFYKATRARIAVNRFFHFVQMSVLTLLIVKFTWIALERYPDRLTPFDDWRSNAFLHKVNEGKGVLLLGPDLSAMQLVTRRPILIDGGALDIISYFPELAGPIREIMNEVYGIDLFNPPMSIQHVAILPDSYSQPVWEARTAEEWIALKKKFGFTQVLTSGWNLQLPETAANESHKLHTIP